MLSMKSVFSSPCKVNNHRVSNGYNELRDFYGTEFNLYYWNWNSKEFNKIKEAILFWGKLNGGIISNKELPN